MSPVIARSVQDLCEQELNGNVTTQRSERRRDLNLVVKSLA